MKQWSKIGVSLRTCVTNFGINYLQLYHIIYRKKLDSMTSQGL